MSELRVNPTRMELTRAKRRLVTAKRGHKLLKDKRDELVRRFVHIARENARVRKEVESSLKNALGVLRARSVMDGPTLESALMYPQGALGFLCAQEYIIRTGACNTCR